MIAEMGQLLEHLHYWQKGGFILIPIAVVCFLIWFYFLTANARLRNALSAPPGLYHDVESQLARGESPLRIGESLSVKYGLFGRIISHALERTARGLDLRHVFDELRQMEISPLERNLVVLRALVASAPLLGLLGTVLGMVETFHVISMKTSWTTEMMASGIGQALITTQFGLVVALPGIFGVSILQRKLRQLELRLRGAQLHLVLGLRRRAR
jgi:biopolymer transport protein ExbB